MSQTLLVTPIFNFHNISGLKYMPDQRLNIRQIENIDTKSILRVTHFAFLT